jgi:5'-nucleotidase
MHLLLSNDDGVHARGLNRLLEKFQMGHQVTVVAPLEEKSATGHTITLSQPLRSRKIEENVYGISGFPADCILFATGQVLQGKNIDLVISGINHGPNLGQDIYYSGTVAAAREASFQRIPAIAVSCVLDFFKYDENPHYETSAWLMDRILQLDIVKHFIPGEYLNINVPNVAIEQLKGCRVAELGLRSYSGLVEKRIDCRGREYFWIGGTYQGHSGLHETDCTLIEQNIASVTPLYLGGVASHRMDYWREVLAPLKF